MSAHLSNWISKSVVIHYIHIYGLQMQSEIGCNILSTKDMDLQSA